MSIRRYVSSWRRVALIGAVVITAALFASDAFARVGGGQGYGGGGSGGGGGDGGGAGALIYLLVRLLIWLTFEHPVIGIPIDIVVIGVVVYWFARPSKKSVSFASSDLSAPDPVASAVQQQGFQRAFNQLR
ncbi:MAG: hypothetical protein ACMG6H_17000, partial [Acidobacteriota bacterium]